MLQDPKKLPLKRQTSQPVYARIVDSIHASILSGELAPGDQLLSERELSDQFGVSRTSVRKAFAVLAGMGLIEVTPRDGAYVKEVEATQAINMFSQLVAQNKDQVDHLYEVRKIIEVEAARLAAMRRQDEDVPRLWELYHEAHGKIHSGNEMKQADINFHVGIAHMTQNPFYSQLMEILLSSIMSVFDVVWAHVMQDEEEEQLFKKFDKQHRFITQAIADRDTDAAVFYMTQHIDDSMKRVQRVIRETGVANNGNG
ncbi:MAG: FadR/GntR family transcriptional regulator [Chloroflexota bacterium]